MSFLLLLQSFTACGGRAAILALLLVLGVESRYSPSSGGNWRSLPPELVKQAMGGVYESGRGKVGFYGRISFSQPSPTLVTSPVQKATIMCHPTQNRPLSVQEYARIQQFPDGWAMGTTAAKYRQIGNAVPVGLATALGKSIIAAAGHNAAIQTKRFRWTNIHNRIKYAIKLQNI